MEKVLILGTGAAGFTAAIYAARANLSPLVVEGPQPGGQLTTTSDIENFPGFPEAIAGPELMDLMRRQAERFGARFQFGAAVSSELRNAPLRVTLDDGQTIETRTLIVATGASARYLGVPSEQALLGRGVTACATCDGAFYKGVPVCVIGGGDTAMEEAVFLTRFASSVTVIHRRDQFRASKIMADRVIQHPKIRVLWNSVVQEVHDVARNEVTGVTVRNVGTGELTRIEVKGYFSAIGHQPNTAAVAGQLETDKNGYLVTQNTRTSIPGVFAAGDVQDAVYRQAITAAGTGCMASLEAERFLESQGH